MYLWFGIALVAYLIGAAIEGISTASHLSSLLPELLKGIENRSLDHSAPQKRELRVVAIIAIVSCLGALCWPCRLLHRSLKDQQDSSG